MALSGTTDFEPNVAEFVEEAFERCGLELRTGYDLKTARRSINLMLAEWANRGLNQWTIEQDTQTVTQGTAEYTLNSNVIDILDVVQAVNIVLGSMDPTPAADLNEDGIVNVLDVIQLINVIIGTN